MARLRLNHRAVSGRSDAFRAATCVIDFSVIKNRRAADRARSYRAQCRTHLCSCSPGNWTRIKTRFCPATLVQFNAPLSFAEQLEHSVWCKIMLHSLICSASSSIILLCGVNPLPPREVKWIYLAGWASVASICSPEVGRALRVESLASGRLEQQAVIVVPLLW